MRVELTASENLKLRGLPIAYRPIVVRAGVEPAASENLDLRGLPIAYLTKN